MSVTFDVDLEKKPTENSRRCAKMVRMKGVEPIRLAALDPKSSASASSATSACDYSASVFYHDRAGLSIRAFAHEHTAARIPFTSRIPYANPRRTSAVGRNSSYLSKIGISSG